MSKSFRVLNNHYSFKIYSSFLELPASWDELATENIFLTKQYFEILEKSAPKNMECHYIGLYKNEELILYCRSGNRSGQACLILETAGFTNVKNLSGGMLNWRETFKV